MIERIILLGPTASGKTGLSLPLAEKIDAEIISVDSRQCYKGLDIGTAKPTTDELKRVPHHNISNLDPASPDSAVQFHDRSISWTESIMKKGKRVLYVGGSTLHLKGIIQPFDNLPSANPETVELLNREVDTHGIESLYRKLVNVDPAYADRLDGLNRQRIIRALDVWEQTGRPFSSFHNQQKILLPDDLLVVGLKLERQELYNRVNHRVDQMLADGLIDETRQLLDTGEYSPELQSFQTVGYRQVIDYLAGSLSYDQMSDDIKTETRRYAKRQLTWFRRWPFIEWLDAGTLSREEMISRIIQLGNGGLPLAANQNKG